MRVAPVRKEALVLKPCAVQYAAFRHAASAERAANPAGVQVGNMKVDHLGVAVESIDKALHFYRTALGLELTHTEVVPEQGVRVAMLPIGESRIELLEPTGPDTPVGKFLAKRGSGIHHICVAVDDIDATLGRLKAQGIPLIDETPRVGAEGCLVAFVHPKGTGGVLVELSQKTAIAEMVSPETTSPADGH